MSSLCRSEVMSTFICLSRSSYFKIRLSVCLSVSISISIYLSPSSIYLLVLSCSIYLSISCSIWFDVSGILKDHERPRFSHLSLEGLRCRRAHGDVKPRSVGGGHHLKQLRPRGAFARGTMWIDVMLLCILFDAINNFIYIYILYFSTEWVKRLELFITVPTVSFGYKCYNQ